MRISHLARCSAAPPPPAAAPPTPRRRKLAAKRARRARQLPPGEELPPPVLFTPKAEPPPRPPYDPAGSELNCPHFAAGACCSAIDRGLAPPPVHARAAAFLRDQLGYEGDFLLRVGALAGWRRRARLAVRRGADADGGGAVVGLFRPGTHDAAGVPGCVAHHPLVTAAAEAVRAGADAAGVAPYSEVDGSGELRYVELTVVDAAAPEGVDGAPGGAAPAQQVQCLLVFNAHDREGAGDAPERLAAELWRRGAPGAADAADADGGAKTAAGGGLFHTVSACFHGARTNAVLPRLDKPGALAALRGGGAHAWAGLAGADVCLAPGAFSQANWGAAGAAITALGDMVPKDSAVVELHAGVGAVGLSVAARRAPRALRLVEVNGAAEAPFRRAWARLAARAAAAGAPAPPRAEYLVADAGGDPGKHLAGADVAIVDPPRKGLEPALLKHLAAGGGAAAAAGAKPRRLLYLSCGWHAFERDAAALLASGGWTLTSAEAFLFFPGTDAIETLACFDRRDTRAELAARAAASETPAEEDKEEASA
jgi:23S rRNA (uracil1939-C5)-methyltransferase